jgi:hypothetical protein
VGRYFSSHLEFRYWIWRIVTCMLTVFGLLLQAFWWS